MRSSSTARGTGTGDLAHGSAIEIDAQDLVRVVHFGERQRQRAAAIADMFLLADVLRQVQVAQRRVGDGRIEDPGRQHLGAADDDAALGVAGHLAIHHVAVAHGDDGLAVLPLAERQFKCLLVEQGDAGQVGIGAVSPRRAARRRGAGRARPGTRQRPRHRGRSAAAPAIPHRSRHRQPLHGADHARAVRFQQRPGASSRPANRGCRR
jgi:hypothetical protein